MDATRARPLPTRDAGFTLAELLVVVSLLGLILAAAYTIAYAVQVGQRNASREASLARAVTQPLYTMEKILVQNKAISGTATTGYTLSGYQLRVLTDQNADDVLEERTFSAVQDADGNGYIDITTYNLDASMNRVGGARQDGHIAFDNANLADGVPLFVYLDASGTEITDMGQVQQRCRSVRVQLRVIVDGAHETHMDTITFRNRGN